jgi:hypothetical protein
MKKHVADLPIDAVTRAFQTATRDAAANAVAAGRLVAGWENGRLTEYGLDKGAREAARVYFAPLFVVWRLLVSATEWLLKR